MQLQFVVNVDEIPKAGLSVDDALATDWVNGALGGNLRVAQKPNPIHLSLSRNDKNVKLSGELSVSFTYVCSRCAESSDSEIEVPIDWTFAPSKQGNDKEKIDAWGISEDADLSVYEGTKIDLEPVIVEHLVFAAPTHPICTDECRGLCAGCGCNLNTSQCECNEEQIDPRWAQLKCIKLGE